MFLYKSLYSTVSLNIYQNIHFTDIPIEYKYYCNFFLFFKIKMHIKVYDPYLTEERAQEIGVEKVTFEELLKFTTNGNNKR